MKNAANPDFSTTTEHGAWIAYPESCTRKRISRLRVADDNGFPISLCNFAVIAPADLIATLEAEPIDDITATMVYNNFRLTNTFDTAANGVIEIWCTVNDRLEMTIAETYVVLQETRDGGHIYFHIHSENAREFPGWISTSWRKRGIAAALATSKILMAKSSKAI